MQLKSWRRLFSRSSSTARSRQRLRAASRRLGLEALEVRAVPAAMIFNVGAIHDLTLLHNGPNIQVVQTSNPLNLLASQSAAVTTTVEIQGVDNVADELTINHGPGIVDVPVVFAGGAGAGDQVIVTGYSFGVVEHTLGGPGVGVISQDGYLVGFTGVESVADKVGAGRRVFHFPKTDDIINLDTGAAPADGITRITGVSAGAPVDFTAPSASLTVNAGDGQDIVEVGELDLSAAEPTVTLNGGEGDDSFLVSTAASVSNTLTIDGGAGLANLANVHDTQIISADGDGFVATNLDNLLIADSTMNGNRGCGVALSFVRSSSLKEVTADRNHQGGLDLEHGELVFIGGGSYSDNLGDGITLQAISQDATLIGVTASSNQRPGVGVHLRKVGSYTDTDGVYQLNAGGGIVVEGIAGDVTLVRTMADDNDANQDGIGDGFHAKEIDTASTEPGGGDKLAAIGGNLLIQGGRFRRTNLFETHQARGIYIESITGSLVFENSGRQGVTITGNDQQGVLISYLGADATLSGGDYSRNLKTNLDLVHVNGQVILQDVTASLGGAGIDVGQANSFSDTNGVYKGNVGHGIELASITGAVTLAGTAADANGGDGLHALGLNGGQAIAGALSVQQGHMSGNGGYGLLVQGGGTSATFQDGEFSDNQLTNIALRFIWGPVDFTKVTASGSQADHGVALHLSGNAPFHDTDGVYSQNHGTGLHVFQTGTVTLTRTVADANGGNGFEALDGIDGDLRVQGGRFRDNDGSGLYVLSLTGKTTLGDSLFQTMIVTGNDQAGVYLGDAGTQVKLSGGDYSGNGDVNIRVGTTSGLVLLKNVTASNGGAGIYVGKASSVLIAGATIDNNDGIGLELFNANPLIGATATLSNSSVSGNSIGIRIDGDLSTVVTLKDDAISSNTKTNSGVASQTGIGVAVLGGAVTVTNSQLSNNTVGALSADADGFLQLTANSIEGNTKFGVTNLSTTPVDAVFNYWGSSTGPTHAANAGGSGDQVGGLVDFAPWSTTAACDTAASPRIINGNLVIGGTTSADTIAVNAVGSQFVVVLNSQNYSSNKSLVTDHIVVYTFNGADTVQVSVSKAAEIHGGDGDDSLVGGSSDDVIWGDSGNDSIWGGSDNDLLIGGPGQDSLFGEGGKDLLLGGEFKRGLMHNGSEAFNYATLKVIAKQWASAGVMDPDLATLADDVLDAEQDTLTGGQDADWYLGNISGGASPFDNVVGFNPFNDKKTSL